MRRPLRPRLASMADSRNQPGTVAAADSRSQPDNRSGSMSLGCSTHHNFHEVPR